VWGNAAMESFFSLLKAERTPATRPTGRATKARADVFDYIERFYDPKRRHATIGYLSPVEFERQAGFTNCVSSKPDAGQRAAHLQDMMLHILEKRPN
jgi:hypothetical protein